MSSKEASSFMSYLQAAIAPSLALMGGLFGLTGLLRRDEKQEELEQELRALESIHHMVESVRLQAEVAAEVGLDTETIAFYRTYERRLVARRHSIEANVITLAKAVEKARIEREQKLAVERERLTAERAKVEAEDLERTKSKFNEAVGGLKEAVDKLRESNEKKVSTSVEGDFGAPEPKTPEPTTTAPNAKEVRRCKRCSVLDTDPKQEVGCLVGQTSDRAAGFVEHDFVNEGNL